MAGSTIDVPDVMVNEELDAMVKNLEARLKEQRITLRQYFTYNGTTEAEYREANRERARERVIRTQALQEFARREGISVEDDEIHAEMDRMLEPFQGEEREAAEKVLGTPEAHHDVEDRIFQRKIVDRLTGIAEGSIEAAKPEETETTSSPSLSRRPRPQQAPTTSWKQVVRPKYSVRAQPKPNRSARQARPRAAAPPKTPPPSSKPKKPPRGSS